MFLFEMFFWPKRVAAALNLVLFVHSMLLAAADCHSEFNRLACLPTLYPMRFPEYGIQTVDIGTHKACTQFSSQRSPVRET
jgi:hypothetical protein